MGKVILILIIVLLLFVFVSVLLWKSNRKLKKELEDVKKTVGFIQEKEKEYDKIKEDFADADDGGQHIIDFLSKHTRDKD